MKTFVRLMLISMLMALAIPAYSAGYSQLMACEQDDDASNQDLIDLASTWLKAAKEQPGGDQLTISLHFPVVAHMGETDFTFVVSVPSLTAWATFMESYEGSAANKIDAQWDELAACPNSALFKSVKIK